MSQDFADSISLTLLVPIPPPKLPILCRAGR